MTTTPSPKAPPKIPLATIVRRVDVTPDLWKIWLRPEAPFKFKPGQYCTIGVDGLERAYSIVSSPYEPEVELFIELVPLPYGNLTPILHKLCTGDRVSMRPRAKGIFVMQDRFVNHLMMSTVTGVVPYVSILRSYLHDHRRGHRFFLLQGASYHDEFTYDKELAEMARQHPDFITYVPTVSRPREERNQEWTGEAGRVNTLLEKYVAKFGLRTQDTLVYACGHPGMIEDVKVRGAALGFEVQEERFWKDDE
ncbi:MAG: ferredoxin--NADP reductase [Chloroflexi bacterium]|nr:ferredoxin--NADP reductase [Chloroflexota bacterium]